MNLTRERIRQVEVKALAKLQALRDMEALRDYVDEGPVGKRRLPVIQAEADEDEDPEAAEDAREEAAARVRVAKLRPILEDSAEFDGIG
jgi:hypothetical protein